MLCLIPRGISGLKSTSVCLNRVSFPSDPSRDQWIEIIPRFTSWKRAIRLIPILYIFMKKR